MSAHQVVKNRIGERLAQEKNAMPRRVRCADAAEGALQNGCGRQRGDRAPLSRDFDAASSARDRACNAASTRVSQSPQRCAHLMQVLKQRAHSAQIFLWRSDSSAEMRIEFAVEVCLHAPVIPAATHAVLVRPLSTNALERRARTRQADITVPMGTFVTAAIAR